MYSAYVLTKESRSMLLEQMGAFHHDVVAHHITYRFPDNSPPPDAKVVVVGFAVNDLVDAVVVEVNGTHIRPDGKIYHITMGVNRNNGGKPVMSNDLLAEGWTQIDRHGRFNLDVTPEVLK